MTTLERVYTSYCLSGASVPLLKIHTTFFFPTKRMTSESTLQTQPNTCGQISDSGLHPKLFVICGCRNVERRLCLVLHVLLCILSVFLPSCVCVCVIKHEWILVQLTYVKNNKIYSYMNWLQIISKNRNGIPIPTTNTKVKKTTTDKFIKLQYVLQYTEIYWLYLYIYNLE